MKKKLPPAKPPLPKFRSDKQAAKYFEEHSVARVWDRLPESKPAKLSPALSKSIRERHVAAQLTPDEIQDEREIHDPKVQAAIRKSQQEFVAGKSRPIEDLLSARARSHSRRKA